MAIPNSTNPSKLSKSARELHRREFFWQVLFPILLCTFLLLVLFVLIMWGAFAQSVNASAMADTTLIWFSLPILGVCGINLAIIAALIYGVSWLYVRLPKYSGQALEFLRKVSGKTRDYSQKVEQPVQKARLAWDKFEQKASNFEQQAQTRLANFTTVRPRKR